MSYINATVTNSATEKDFIEQFITSFASKDNRIVRDQTPEEVADMFDASTGDGRSKIPTFSFTVCGIVKITFKRANTLSNSVSVYTITFGYKNRSYQLSIAFTQQSNISYSIAAERTYKYQIISNDKLISIRFGGYNATLPLATSVWTLIYHDSQNTDNDFLATGSNGTYYVGEDAAKASKITRLPYIRNLEDFTEIEVIKNTVLVSYDTNEAVRTIDGMWDASTNYAVNVPLKIGTEQCCFLDSNTVMKC